MLEDVAPEVAVVLDVLLFCVGLVRHDTEEVGDIPPLVSEVPKVMSVVRLPTLVVACLR